MISNVSFGSTYKIQGRNLYTKEAEKAHKDFQEYTQDNNVQYYTTGYTFKTGNKPYNSPIFRLQTTVVTPDNEDTKFETFCANKGIQFVKHSTKDMMDKQAIISRIQDAPEGMTKTMVDVEQLYSLSYNNPDSNLLDIEEDYKDFSQEEVSLMILGGDKFPAPTLLLRNSDNEDSPLVIEVIRQTDYPDNTGLIGLVDSGLKQIPVYVDKESLETGKKLGLLK